VHATAWVFAGVKWESGGTCLAPVADRFSKTLVAITACILPGTTIISDCWGPMLSRQWTHAPHHQVQCQFHGFALNNTNSPYFITFKWSKIDHNVPQDFLLGPLLCLLLINDLLKIVNNTSVPVLFTDDNSILFAHNKSDSLNTNMHYTLKVISKWLKANLL